MSLVGLPFGSIAANLNAICVLAAAGLNLSTLVAVSGLKLYETLPFRLAIILYMVESGINSVP